jgi:hypothetical protein
MSSSASSADSAAGARLHGLGRQCAQRLQLGDTERIEAGLQCTEGGSLRIERAERRARSIEGAEPRARAVQRAEHRAARLLALWPMDGRFFGVVVRLDEIAGAVEIARNRLAFGPRGPRPGLDV